MTRDYRIKAGYVQRPTPDYFVDLEASEGVIYQPLMYQDAARVARAVGATTIIDIGCGNGYKLAELHPEFELIGIDFGINLETCRSRYPFATWLEHDLDTEDPLPLTPQQLANSVIVNSDVIEHLVRPELLLGKLAAALQHAKAVLLSTPERDRTWGVGHDGPPPNPHHTREWNLEELALLLEDEGFEWGTLGCTQSHNRAPDLHTIQALVTADEATLVSALPALSGHDRTLGSAVNTRDVSVVIRTFNRAHLLPLALDSLVSQTFAKERFEVVVVNDAGEDPTPTVGPYMDQLDIRIVHHDRNRGMPAASNTGIRNARGRYICLLDDDDRYLPNHIESLFQAAEELGGNTVVYADALCITEDADGRPVNRSLAEVPVEFSRDLMLCRNFIPVLCLMVPRHVYDSAGLFDEALAGAGDDWDMWLRASAAFPFRHVQQVTAEYSIRAGFQQSTTRDLFRHHRMIEQVYQRHPLPAGHPILALRERHFLASHAHNSERFAYDYSVLVDSHGDVAALQKCLESVIVQMADRNYEVVIHTPPSEQMQAFLNVLDGDVTFSFGEPGPHVADILEAKAAGRQHVLLIADREMAVSDVSVTSLSRAS